MHDAVLSAIFQARRDASPRSPARLYHKLRDRSRLRQQMRCFDHDALMHASAALDAINEDYQLSTTGRDTHRQLGAVFAGLGARCCLREGG
jgi:hypothetical protein